MYLDIHVLNFWAIFNFNYEF